MPERDPRVTTLETAQRELKRTLDQAQQALRDAERKARAQEAQIVSLESRMPRGAGTLIRNIRQGHPHPLGTGAHNTLDQAYDEAGAGAGRTITVDSGEVLLQAASTGISGAAGTVLTLEDTGNAYLTILSGASSEGGILFGDSGDADIGRLIYDHANNRVVLYTGNAARIRASASTVELGHATLIGTIGSSGTADSLLHVFKATAGVISAVANTIATLENADPAYLSFLTPATSDAGLVFGDPDDADVGKLIYDHSTNSLKLTLAASAVQQFGANGIEIVEAADHPFTPAATKGQIWVKNTTPNELWFTDDAGTDTQLGAGGGGTPGGVDTQVQFNDGGAFGGDAGLTYAKATDALTVAGSVSVPAIKDSGGTTQLTIAASSPHVTIENDLRVDGVIGISGSTPLAAGRRLHWESTETGLSGQQYGIYFAPALIPSAATDIIATAVFGQVSLRADGGTTGNSGIGLSFQVAAPFTNVAAGETATYIQLVGTESIVGAGGFVFSGTVRTIDVTEAIGVVSRPVFSYSGAAAAGTITTYSHFKGDTGTFSASITDVATMNGLWLRAPGATADITDYYGVFIERVTGNKGDTIGFYYGAAAAPTGTYGIFIDDDLARFDGDGTTVFEVPNDTAGVGTTYGRIPITITGIGTKYIEVFNAP